MDINRLREILRVQLTVIAILFVILIVHNAMIAIVIEINFFKNNAVKLIQLIKIVIILL